MALAALIEHTIEHNFLCFHGSARRGVGSSNLPGRDSLSPLRHLRRQQPQKMFPITKGWCPPALPSKIDDRSNPFGPRSSFPTVVFARVDERHPPASGSATEGVFDQRPSFGHDARITGIMQFE